ncbi:hypothetical protein D3C76_1861150 [compost metagenome]
MFARQVEYPQVEDSELFHQLTETVDPLRQGQCVVLFGEVQRRLDGQARILHQLAHGLSG